MHATHYGGTGELYEKFISKIEYIDQMKRHVHGSKQMATMLLGFGKVHVETAQ
jgi:hypothetical protein